jgi:predicted unusual protein kinase regulating ubiquinone biosynthesis (AarF/ABC1/UbiB family)
MSRRVLASLLGAGALAGAVLWRRGSAPGVVPSRRIHRNLHVGRLVAVRSADEAATRLRQRFLPSERARAAQVRLERRHAEEVVRSLGTMKGALMKLGQMASYLDEGLPEPMRESLAQLQQDAPPMDTALVVDEVERELGGPLHRWFAAFDEEPLAAASIGQVHAARTLDGDDVVVKVQYPGIADAIGADLDNTETLGNLLRLIFPGLEPAPLVAELRARLGEELDYRVEAANQQLFADFYAGHPFIRIPAVHHPLCTQRVLVTQRSNGARFSEVETWDQAERDLAGETIFRFVFRSLYRLRAFNGDPHPGNYLFLPGGIITFLDFGLVKRYSAADTEMFRRLITSMVRRDAPAFRQTVEQASILRRNAPFDDEEVLDWFGHYYEIVSADRVVTITREYASTMLGHTFDARNNEILRWANVPPVMVLTQRINLGLYALLGKLEATANYRRIAEELWPWVDGPPSTPQGRREAVWLARAPA